MSPTFFCLHIYSNDTEFHSTCPILSYVFQHTNISCTSKGVENLTFSIKDFLTGNGTDNDIEPGYCIYELDDCNELTLHKNGQHLVTCETINCSATQFKCPGYYCIPFRYVCNGRWECPGGREEDHCNRSNCPGLFRCWKSTICISPQDVCDGIIDCPHGDDTRFCYMTLPPCPTSCVCMLFSFNIISPYMDCVTYK